MRRISQPQCRSLLLSKSKDYFQSTGRNYWEELIEEERELGERYIAENETLALVASYAPRGFREIQFVFKSANSFIDLNDDAIEDFAESLVKMLYGYKKWGGGVSTGSPFPGRRGKNRITIH
jgi:galactose-1-phosphate uridylyltransferase